MRQLHKIKLHGELKEVAGVDEVTIGADSIREVFNALMVLFPATKELIYRSTNFSLGVLEDGKVVRWLDVKDIQFGIPTNDGLLLGLDIEGGVFGWDDIFMIIVTMAINWAITRAIVLLSDKPKTQDAQKDKDSYLLSGAKNSTKAGSAVPLLFGRYRAGSVVISSSLTSSRIGVSRREDYTFSFVEGTRVVNILDNDRANTLGFCILKTFSVNGGTTYTLADGASQMVPIGSEGNSITLKSDGTCTVSFGGTVTGIYYVNIKYTAIGLPPVGMLNGPTSYFGWDTSSNCNIVMMGTPESTGGA